ncbi:HelD family protein [Actinoplanes utahensis]|uniref:ATPase AAA n=1 Tax=Actinoplanes utahensis TaxID=1869 RepID=A0A0A6U9L2_ACTUT|nr:AAA family ATPase [Actinoplanes utahensis]KHD72091.1 ATPase AAA [Actinoplanes utahensis]GIF28838.1 DNA helicase [Actinoplanes utahensis]
MREADTAPATEIDTEARYLAQARAALRAMRADVLATETPESVAADSDDVWQNTMYRMARAKRGRDLVDLPDVPLFFGRLDYEPGLVYEDAADDQPDRVYVGRRHVRDDEGRPLVVDWRAPISVPFYQATRQDRRGVRLRRRFGFSDIAELTAYEDEPLAGPAAAQGGGALLAAEIDRPRAGPMRDIVATIQPEQDDLVRAPLQPSLCVQGAPGTGKTAVGLHRLAYLLYTEADRLTNGVVVVGPNRSFLAYIRHVLPALGEVAVRQRTVEELVGRTVTSTDTAEVARLKGDPRMAEMLRRALWRHVGEPSDDLVYAQGATRYRVAQARLAELVFQQKGSARYGTGRAGLAQRVANLVLMQMERRGATPDDRDLAVVSRSKPVRALLDAIWPKLTPEQVLFRLLADADVLAEAAEDLFTAEEQAALRWSRPYRSARSAKWSAPDAVLLDELSDLIDRVPSLSHLMIDEAQDLSPMQCRALGRRCLTGSVTVLGDIAQGTGAWPVDDWPTLLGHLGKPEARLAFLDRGFRVPEQIIRYAARLLPHISPGLPAPTSVRSSTGALRITATSAVDLPDAVVRACREFLGQPGSTGLICADQDIDVVSCRLRADGLEASLLGEDEDALESNRLICVPASQSKGLEFDAVIVMEPAHIVAAEPRGLRRLYVVLTRAVSALHIVHAEPLPEALTARLEPRPPNGTGS